MMWIALRADGTSTAHDTLRAARAAARRARGRLAVVDVLPAVRAPSRADDDHGPWEHPHDGDRWDRARARAIRGLP